MGDEESETKENGRGCHNKSKNRQEAKRRKAEEENARENNKHENAVHVPNDRFNNHKNHKKQRSRVE